MKRKLVSVIVAVFCLAMFTACDADKLNSTIENAASAAGVDVDVNIKQEQIDDIKKKAKESADKVKDIATDEEVHKAAKDLIDSLSNAAKENSNNE